MVRMKNRYIVCELCCADKNQSLKKVQLKDIQYAVRSSVSENFGIYGSTFTCKAKYWNDVTGMLILKTDRGAHRMMQLALTFTQHVKGLKVMFRVIHLGGTIRSCYKFMIRYNQKVLSSLLKKCTSQEERDLIKTSIAESRVTFRQIFSYDTHDVDSRIT